jgi:hypothetical protein
VQRDGMSQVLSLTEDIITSVPMQSAGL